MITETRLNRFSTQSVLFVFHIDGASQYFCIRLSYIIKLDLSNKPSIELFKLVRVLFEQNLVENDDILRDIFQPLVEYWFHTVPNGVWFFEIFRDFLITTDNMIDFQVHARFGVNITLPTTKLQNGL